MSSNITRMDIPQIIFDDWSRWNDRGRPSHEIDDVPSDFGCLGLYLLATSDVDSHTGAGSAKHLHPGVLYIGMSTHVDRRLERYHSAVRAYRREQDDRTCQRLRFSAWRSEWSMYARPGIAKPVVEIAALKLYERALLYEFARKYGRLPPLNRE
nr:hypothetical protein HUO10_002741 [Paraburkholderia busanensis]